MLAHYEELHEASQSVRDFTSLLSCRNIVTLNLDGATLFSFMISVVVLECPNIEHLSLCGITDPDSGASIKVISSSKALRTLNVSC